jgi:hypothetical protein
MVITQQFKGDAMWVCWTKARERSFAALRMTNGCHPDKPLAIILSAAKDP